MARPTRMPSIFLSVQTEYDAVSCIPLHSALFLRSRGIEWPNSSNKLPFAGGLDANNCQQAIAPLPSRGIAGGGMFRTYPHD